MAGEEKMRRGRVVLVGIAAVAIAAIFVALASIAPQSIKQASPFSTVLALQPPDFINETEALGAPAFPEESAGISAYVKVNQTINVTDPKVLDVFKSLSELGENYVIGTVEVNNNGKKINVNVYADSNGWIVAYFSRGTPVAAITNWDIEYPEIKDSVLHEAIEAFCSGAGIDYADISKDIKFYHFGVPEADKIVAFMNTINQVVLVPGEPSETSKRIYVLVPSKYSNPYSKPILREFSYSIFCKNKWDKYGDKDEVGFYRDGSLIRSVKGNERETWGTFTLSYGEPHILELRVINSLEHDQQDWGGLCVMMLIDER